MGEQLGNAIVAALILCIEFEQALGSVIVAEPERIFSRSRLIQCAACPTACWQLPCAGQGRDEITTFISDCTEWRHTNGDIPLFAVANTVFCLARPINGKHLIDEGLQKDVHMPIRVFDVEHFIG